MVAIFYVVISFFEVVELVFVFSLFMFFLFRPQIRSALEFTLSGIIQPLNAALFKTDYVSAFESRVFTIRRDLCRYLGHIRSRVKLAAEGTFVNLELEDFFIGINEVFVFVFVFKSILKREAFYIFSGIKLSLDLGDDRN
jgi:hypothetical protein